MFSKGGPKPWHTKPGHSKLEGLIAEARDKNLHVKDVGVPLVTEKEAENVTSVKAEEGAPVVSNKETV